tara:strand:+ start:1164 stop:1703 length:540 start_codon:yes stop_codon:yes gene_type:complete
MARSYTIYDCHELAHNKNGQCLSGKFIAMHSILEWNCNKHKVKFTSSLKDVFGGKWCEACKVEKRLPTPPVVKIESISNPVTINKTIYEKAYDAMRNITDKEFTAYKPEWLYGLELDGYNEELEIAYVIKRLECYEPNSKSYVEHLAKKELCLENDITLIEVPYWVVATKTFLIDKLDA